VVTVVFNYRLGVLGFLASESMKGNYGLKDQRLALQWTNDNIAGFGGDPRKVTIAGQSAGASSVAALMTMEPGPTGLFRAAIMASNPLALPMHTRPSAKTNADSFSAYVGCPMEDLVCLRAQAVDDILDAQRNSVPLDFSDFFINFLPFSPLVDAGGVLPVQPFEALAAGQFDPVPMLSGTALDEGWLFVRELFPSPVNPPAYRALFRVLFGADASDRVLQQYPFDLAGDAADGRATLNILASDLLFHCPLRNITRGYHQDPRKADTFMYLFNHAMSFNAWLPNNGYCYGYVCHGSELPFAFNVFTDGDETFETTEGELQLSRDMVRTWVNFVRNVDPNEGGAIPPTGYPLYDPVTDLVAVQDTPSFQVYAQYRSEFCDLWDALGYFY
jgi:carboxylesterase type B